MIAEFKSEFDRISTNISAGFTTKKMSELEDYVQSYDFTEPLINWKPIESFNPSIGQSNQVIQNGTCVLQFIEKAVTNDNYEDVKDSKVDQMIDLSSNFLRKLNENENGVFIGSAFTGTSTIKRNFTSNYCVAVELTITFTTSINYDFNRNCGTGTIPLTNLQYTNNYQQIELANADGAGLQSMVASLSPAGATADFVMTNSSGIEINASTGEIIEGTWEDIPIGLTVATVEATGNGNYKGTIRFIVVFNKKMGLVLSEAEYTALTDVDDQMYYLQEST